ncbi:MAG: hypothetical protein RIC35_16055 [Marinoscillum sp.]
MKGRVLFKETQTFKGTFFWWLQTILIVAIIGGLILGKLLMIFGVQAFQSIQPEDSESMIAIIIALIVLGGVFWLLSLIKMVVEIDEAGLYYTYFPFVSSKRSISKSDLISMSVRKYSPILEYGGWGYRRSFRNGKALNVQGKYGLQVEYKDGKKLLLGTQKPAELDQVVKQLKEKWGMH